MKELIMDLRIANKTFNIGFFLDVALVNGLLHFTCDNDIVACEVPGKKIRAFRYRKKLKAVVLKQDNDIVSVQIINYAEIHRHSGYSLLDGGTHINDLVDRTDYVGALTDHGVMYGILDFYKKMKAAGKKPILGFEGYTESIDGSKSANHLLLLAKNIIGYYNLIKLSSEAYNNFYRRPQITYDMLRKYSEGIIATSACLGGEIPRLLTQNKYDEAVKVASELVSIFGKDDFYIEIQKHGIKEEQIIEPLLIKLAKELGLKIVAATDSHYLDKEDREAHEALLCIGTGKKMTDDKRMRFSGTGYHCHTADEVEELFKHIPEALDSTLEIAEKCNVELDLNTVHMPKFDVPPVFADEASYFEHICWEGFKERYEGTVAFTDVAYNERLLYEIDVIKKMGFPGYFLIVNDFVMFAKKNDIYVGPGRGSACGSLVSYCLNITDVDPIPYGLLFERFLNVDRVSMPDIDLDFDDNRREEVINYVKEKYGTDCVSRIITFGTLSAKAVVRDVARVLDLPYSIGDKISKSIPEVPKMTLDKAYKESIEFKKLYDNDEEVKIVVDIAKKLEGLPRNVSQHACGVLISPSVVTNYIPQVLIEDEKTKVKEATTQYTMTECEEAGLLKMDFLGLRTMGVASNTIKEANKKRKKLNQSPIDFDNIPLTDVAVYEHIAKGNTHGVFQLESAGMTSFMKELFQDVTTVRKEIEAKYTSDVERKVALFNYGLELFERAVAGISLYRPGPIDEIPNYINNMLNPEYIEYDDDLLIPILSNTYGIIVYQEQVMFVVRELAGFTKGMADNVRKAMSKKKEKDLEYLGELFLHGEVDKNGNVIVPGCIRNGITEGVAQKLWKKMKKFGEYAFNKSHAVGYAVIAIKTAWLTYYYPVEYMSATLNSFIHSLKKIKLNMSICKKKKIKILAPDVNSSSENFNIDDGSIRFGLKGIKNMGATSVLIKEEREIRGNFKSFQDFAERMAVHAKINKKILEALIYSGAADCFHGTRRAKLSILENILVAASNEKSDHQTGQLSLFAIDETMSKYKEIPIPDIDDFEKKMKLGKEKEFAGFYVTEHPLDEYLEYFEKEGVSEIGFIVKDEEDEEDSYSYDGESVKVAGIITEVNLFYTKKDNKPMYTFTVEDVTGEMKCVLFADKVQANRSKLIEGKVILIDGTVKTDDFGTQVIVNTICDIESIYKSGTPKSVWVKTDSNEKLSLLNSIINVNKGEIPVFVYYNGKSYKANGRINLNLAALSRLQESFNTNLKVMYN